MSDSQWPLYEVFHQTRPGKPHRNIGTVHAPDAEMALLNGRDLFVRRPECHSLWVAPTAAILSTTIEEIESDAMWLEKPPLTGEPTEIYFVFVKDSQRRTMSYVRHVGSVQASSPTEAMRCAVSTFASGQPFVWWVCPERAITRSKDDDVESMFAPARDKSYRMPNQYRTVEAMRKASSEVRAQLDESANDAA